jgi:chaperone required for assembly of F1-ATPase
VTQSENDNEKDAGRGVKPPSPVRLPKRFYKTVSVIRQDEAFTVCLDERPLRTPMKAPLALPTSDLAEAVRDEWERQQEHIDPATMPLTRLANSAIDGVRPHRRRVVDDIVDFAASDLICYRAPTPSALVALQSQHWDPVLAWASSHLGAEMRVVTGVMPVKQNPEALSAIRDALGELGGFALTAVHEMTVLSGSALIALACQAGHLAPEPAWAAGHVDEAWQMSQWGQDADAAARQAIRTTDWQMACRLAQLAGEFQVPATEE